MQEILELEDECVKCDMTNDCRNRGYEIARAGGDEETEVCCESIQGGASSRIAQYGSQEAIEVVQKTSWFSWNCL